MWIDHKVALLYTKIEASRLAPIFKEDCNDASKNVRSMATVFYVPCREAGRAEPELGPSIYKAGLYPGTLRT